MSIRIEHLGIISLVVIVCVAILFIYLERRFPYNKDHHTLRQAFWSDLIYYGIIQNYVMGLIIAWFIVYLDKVLDASRLHLVSHWPIWCQVLFFVVTHDFITYFIHRNEHQSKVLWRLHEAHHSCRHVDWLSGIRAHALEVVYYETAKFLPIILLGASPEVALWRAMIDSSYGMFIHSNLNVRLGPLLYLLNGPEIHRWHHANLDPMAFNKNFATKFVIWDRIFGTLYNPNDAQAGDYGPDDPHWPESGFWRQFFFCFRPFKKRVLKEASV